jgi:hypothetical protein
LLILQKKIKKMKKMILSGFVVAAIALVAFNFYNKESKETLSDLAKANIEALAEQEKPGPPGNLVDYSCYGCTGKYGQCLSTMNGKVFTYCGTCTVAYMTYADVIGWCSF